MVATLKPADAVQLLASPDVQLVDVRDPHETASGSIEGAHLIPMDMLRADPDAALPNRDARIVFICAKGVRSLAAAKLADRLGYANVFSLDGGLVAWTKAGLPLAIHAERVAA